ncbi:MAG TPA: class I poly(R)-hydroxyalkanoic acid synthase [Burkholderiaceae bacterium]|jgi:polyhydroxyalkanoate synthase|nr:class I poly(R)-hydroxyalkanoic acid synthase [Burkholderiaceae bacterium]
MKAMDFEAMTPAWIAQLAGPGVWQEWLKQQQVQSVPLGAVGELGKLIDPAVATQLQSDYMREFSALCQDMMASKVPAITDKRFAGPAWQTNPLNTFNVAAYLLNTRFLLAMADNVQASARVKQKVKFAVQQMVDAMSPANFLVTNPEAQQKIVESKGESLTNGIVNMLADMQKGKISQSDESAFVVGKNVATTEGQVVFENPLFQLIQYKPLSETVFERPLLLVPPCINKYYILDLQPENSLVRYAIEQGHTVFLVSWCNPDKTLGDRTWDNYIEDAAIKAIHVVQEISGREQINTLGFCVGGTILSTALAVLAARNESPAASMTLLTSLLDFSDTGILDVFIDEAQVAMREQAIGQGGLMPGRDFASAFSSLRSNDLVWSYVKSNYLKGEFPPAFDLLYWNADSTNMPGPMFCWYLRNLYLEDSLKVPGKLTVAGQKVDLAKIDAPAFIYASREDHIVPWTAAYASTYLINPKKPNRNRFVLGASGHIAGVINPPAKKKRSYWINANLPSLADDWLLAANEQPGSWWTEWAGFLVENAGKKVKAPRATGSKKYPPIEAAPGRYVAVKAE